MECKGNISKIEGEFESSIIVNTSFVVAIASLLITIVSLWIGLNNYITILAVSAFPVFSVFFLLGYRCHKFELLRWLIPLVATIYINLLWYYKYVSEGPALVLFVLYYCFINLIASKKQIIAYNLIAVINLIVLFIIEYKYSEHLLSYPSETVRIIDTYVVTFVSLGVMFNFLHFSKKSYKKQYLKAREADNLKSAFLANMSHEIRTPLNAIVGFSSLLAQRELNEKKKEKYKSFIESNSKYLLHLVNDILDISKIESNQLTLIVDEFRVSKLCEQFKEEYGNILQKQNKEQVKINYQLPEMDLTIKTDKFRLEQILRNFLTNAVKFTDKGTIKFGCYRKDESLVFYVEDTGEGITKEELKLIFSRFTKLNSDGEDIHQGAGLGLYLSKQLASLMGGEIWAESVKGKGSTFYLSLPA